MREQGTRGIRGREVTALVVAALGAGAVLGVPAPARAAEADGGVVARMAGGFAHTVFVSATGVPYGVGSNDQGQLTGTGGRTQLAPLVGLPSGVRATEVAAGGYFTLVRGSDGVVYVTGSSEVAGLAPAGGYRTLTAVPGLPAGVRATDVAAGNYHAVVLGSDGVAYGIGDNSQGQVTAATPATSSLGALAGLPEGTTAVGVAAGRYESYVLGSDGVAYGAGDNGYGQLTGSGDRDELAPLVGLPGDVAAVQVAGGDYHSVVVGSDGLAYGSGYNANAQLTGSGSKSSLTPLDGLPEDVEAVAATAGVQHTVVLGSDGVAYGAGLNDDGQLTGDGNKTSLEPLEGLPAGVDVASVEASDHDTLVLGTDGVLYGTGDNTRGQVSPDAGTDVATLTRTSGQVLAATAVPVITGTPGVAGVLTASTGSWSPAPTGLTYQWSVGGVPVTGANGTSYGVRGVDVGRSVTVTVTATRDGFVTASASSAATARVPSVDSRTRVTILGGRTTTTPTKRLRLLAEVDSVPPVVSVAGRVRILDTTRKGGRTITRTLATATLRQESVVVRLPRLARGKHTLVVRYLGSATVRASAAKKVVVRVR